MIFVHVRRFTTATSTARGVFGRHGRPIPTGTVWGRLHDAHLWARSPRILPPLTATHRQHRHFWAHLQQHQRRDMVLFTDESSFCLSPPDRRIRVWRQRRERHAPQCVVPSIRSGRVNVMVWGGIAQESRAPLHIFHRGITGAIYTQDILAATWCPFSTPALASHTSSRTMSPPTPTAKPGSIFRSVGFRS